MFRWDYFTGTEPFLLGSTGMPFEKGIPLLVEGKVREE
jgi:hypothetical protein